jgi:hypothetical protein
MTKARRARQMSRRCRYVYDHTTAWRGASNRLLSTASTVARFESIALVHGRVTFLGWEK